MNKPEIEKVKNLLESLKHRSLVAEWELPYENLLTRLTAAIFFINPVDDIDMSSIWAEFKEYEYLSYRINTEGLLSKMKYRMTFNKEEKEAGMAAVRETSPANVA